MYNMEHITYNHFCHTHDPGSKTICVYLSVKRESACQENEGVNLPGGYAAVHCTITATFM